MKNNYILLGLPGSGKDSISKLLFESSGQIHLSTGDILREERKKNSKESKEIMSLIDNGNFVPDKLIEDIVMKRLKQTDIKKNGYILDGYPRNMNQLNSFLKTKHLEGTTIILLNTEEDITTKRMLKRGRKDDTKSVIKKRFNVFKEQTKPVIEFLKNNPSNKTILSINASSELNEVWSSIKKKLGKSAQITF